MKGYKPQFADKSSYYDCNGHRLSVDELTDRLLSSHEHGAEIAALMNDVYRPEQLHANGSLNDTFIPESERPDNDRTRHNMADGRETVVRKYADLEDMSHAAGGLWDSLQDAYTGYIKNTRRWRDGYKPEAIKPDARFARRVNETKLRMSKNRKYRAKLERRWNELFGA